MIQNYDKFSKQNVEYTFFKKIISIQQRLTKKGDALRQLQVFLIICWKKIYTKISFYEKIKLRTKRPTILGWVGSFDCELTLLWEKYFFYYTFNLL
jgi:hypothetical protein